MLLAFISFILGIVFGVYFSNIIKEILIKIKNVFKKK